jgi:tetratricopeptide (TPR) repeat protein
MKFSALLLNLVFLSGLSHGAALAASAEASPAEQRITLARTAIEKNPQLYQSHAQLAMALAQRARETADTNYYTQAEAAIAQSLKLSPGNLEARKAEIWVMLGQHEFAEALKAAQALNKEVPDDVQVYGFLADAQVELGNYAEAERAVQWMLDLRPGNIPGLTRAAHLRELFGDISGSLDLMEQAYQRTPPSEREDRAWLLTHMAHLQLLDKQLAYADALLQQALQQFPDYHYALALLAKVRQAQARPAEAIALLRQHVEVAPHPENFFYLGEVLAQNGHAKEASAVFKKFAGAAVAESASWDNANRELIAYYADYAQRPTDALKLAEREIARRHDVLTLDAYAWALYRNGHFSKAQQAIDRALAVGVRDPELHYHAGMIALKQGANARARDHLETALRFAPWADFSASARAALKQAALGQAAHA